MEAMYTKFLQTAPVIGVLLFFIKEIIGVMKEQRRDLAKQGEVISKLRGAVSDNTREVSELRNEIRRLK